MTLKGRRDDELDSLAKYVYSAVLIVKHFSEAIHFICCIAYSNTSYAICVFDNVGVGPPAQRLGLLLTNKRLHLFPASRGFRFFALSFVAW